MSRLVLLLDVAPPPLIDCYGWQCLCLHGSVVHRGCGCVVDVGHLAAVSIQATF